MNCLNAPRTWMANAAVIALVAAAPSLHAQARDSAGVRRAVADYVEGFYEGDSTKHVRSVHPDVYKIGYYRPADSTRYGAAQRMTWQGFHAYANRIRTSGQPAPATAPKKIELLDVLDQTAAAKLTAWWGIDYLLLGRVDGKWMITHVLWQSPPRP